MTQSRHAEGSWPGRLPYEAPELAAHLLHLHHLGFLCPLPPARSCRRKTSDLPGTVLGRSPELSLPLVETSSRGPSEASGRGWEGQGAQAVDELGDPAARLLPSLLAQTL